MEKGNWITLNRKLLNNPISHRPLYLSLWVILLLKANYDDNSFILGGKKQKCVRGQFLTGRKQLSIESGISESQVERILTYFENEQQIEQQKTNKFRLILIKNYDKYQLVEQQVNNKRTTRSDKVGQQESVNSIEILNKKIDENKNLNNKRTTKNSKVGHKQKYNKYNNIIDETSNKNKTTNKLEESIQFNSHDYIEKLILDKQRHIQLIGKYFKTKGLSFPTKLSANTELKRWLKTASVLSEYNDEQINKAAVYVKRFENWSLEAILKNVSKF